ncbi:MAG TPA: response regulator [Anaeromyxobacteraceae bacterium]|nr:response regulator [Anaeromyxobacteraceae bacterium]
MSEQQAREGAQTLLLVDDDEVYRERLARALRDRGYEVSTASGGEEAIALARREAPELAVVDLRMPGASGIEVLEALRAVDPATRVLMLTGYGSIATAVEATRKGAVGYLSKPADADEVVAALTGRAAGDAGADIDTPSLARAEWEHIQRVLADCGGNVSETARRLGIHRRSLQRKLQKYPPTR